MANFFQHLIHNEPHSLNSVRRSIDADLLRPSYFLHILKKHHDFIQESILPLAGSELTAEQKQFHLQRLIQLFEMHGVAEEETLYRQLRRNSHKLTRLEGFCGHDEHKIIFQVRDDLQRLHCETEWTDEIEAKSKVLANYILKHLQDEERIMFPLAQSHLSAAELRLMCVDYLKKCKFQLGGLTAPEASPLGLRPSAVGESAHNGLTIN